MYIDTYIHTHTKSGGAKGGVSVNQLVFGLLGLLGMRLVAGSRDPG